MIRVVDAEDIEFEKILLKDADYAELASKIRIKMEEIRDAQSCERSGEEGQLFPLVRVDNGDGMGG